MLSCMRRDNRQPLTISVSPVTLASNRAPVKIGLCQKKKKLESAYFLVPVTERFRTRSSIRNGWIRHLELKHCCQEHVSLFLPSAFLCVAFTLRQLLLHYSSVSRHCKGKITKQQQQKRPLGWTNYKKPLTLGGSISQKASLPFLWHSLAPRM